MASSSTHTAFADAYTEWCKTETVPEDVSAGHWQELLTPSVVSALKPLQVMFLGLVEWHEGRFVAAAEHIFQACRSEDSLVMNCAAVRTIRAICFPDLMFFEGDDDDDDINADSDPVEVAQRLSKVLEKNPIGAAAAGEAQKTPRVSVATPPESRRASAVFAALWIRRRLARGTLPRGLAFSVQKLLFYADALFRNENGGSSMLDANPTAMNNGPVYFDAWRAIKLLAEAGQPPTEMPADFEVPDFCEQVLIRVCDALGSLSCEDLIDLTHSEMPWRDAVARAARTGEHTVPISGDSMASWFTSEGGSTVPRVVRGELPLVTLMNIVMSARAFRDSVEAAASTVR